MLPTAQTAEHSYSVQSSQKDQKRKAAKEHTEQIVALHTAALLNTNASRMIW